LAVVGWRGHGEYIEMAINLPQKRKVERQLKHILESQQDPYFLIVLGAGVSAAATAMPGIGPHPCATWSGLVRRALEHLLCKTPSGSSALGRRLEHSLRGALDEVKAGGVSAEALADYAEWIIEGFAAKSIVATPDESFSHWLSQEMASLEVVDQTIFDSLSALISALGPQRVIVATTNYDRLISDHFGREAISLTVDMASGLDRIISDPGHYVVHLHGRSGWRGESVFSKLHYQSLCAHNAQPDSGVSLLFKRCIPILIGCGEGIFDADLTVLLADRIVRNHDLDAIAITDGTVDANRALYGCGLHLFGDEHADLPKFLQAIADELPGANNDVDAAIRAYVAQILSEQVLVKIPPATFGAATVSQVPLQVFFADLHSEPVRHTEMLAAAAGLAPTSRRYFRKGGETSAMTGAPSGPTVEWRTPLTKPFSLILGDPGSGKTSLVRLLVREAAELFLTAPQAVSSRLPIFVRIPDYHRDAASEHRAERLSLHAWIVRHFVSMANLADDGEARANALLREYAQAGRLVIVLDGLDEVSEPADRQMIVGEAERLARWLRSSVADRFLCGIKDLNSPEYGLWRGVLDLGDGPLQNRLIVTSRVSGYLNAPISSEEVEVFAVGRMGEAQLLRFFEAFFANVALAYPELAAAAADMAARLPSEYRRSELRTLQGTPLLAAMIAGVYCADGTLPIDEIGLFERVTELSCDHTVSMLAAETNDPPDLDRSQIMQIIGRAAYEVFESDLVGDLIPRQALERAILAVTRPRTSGPPEAHVFAVTAAVANDFGLLQQKTPQLYGFVHRGLQEFLCGRHAARLGGTSDHVIGAMSRRPGSTQPVRFAIIQRLKDSQSGAISLAAEMQRVSADYNGLRPWLLFLGALSETSGLTSEVAAEVASLHLALIPRLGGLLERKLAHPPLNRTLVKLGALPVFEDELRGVLRDALATAGDHPIRARAAACVCEVMSIQDSLILDGLSAAWGRAKGQEAYMRGVLRRLTSVIKTEEGVSL